jgi:hypothetical protein
MKNDFYGLCIIINLSKRDFNFEHIFEKLNLNFDEIRISYKDITNLMEYSNLKEIYAASLILSLDENLDITVFKNRFVYLDTNSIKIEIINNLRLNKIKNFIDTIK